VSTTPPVPSPAVPVLEMRHATVTAMRNPEWVVAAHVNWVVHPGEFWVVGAPQRAGKSDFLMTASGLMPPRDGAVWFRGERLPIFEEEQLPWRLKLGLVFAGGQLLHSLSVAENIALPLRYHAHWAEADIQSRVTQLLEAMELTPWAHWMPAQVARSWSQRAGLARVLALAPELLLVDSPLAGLDIRHTWWWLDMLTALSRGHEIMGGKPLTLCVTAHNLQPWRHSASHFACLHQRRFRVLGDWAAVVAQPAAGVRELLRE